MASRELDVAAVGRVLAQHPEDGHARAACSGHGGLHASEAAHGPRDAQPRAGQAEVVLHVYDKQRRLSGRHGVGAASFSRWAQAQNGLAGAVRRWDASACSHARAGRASHPAALRCACCAAQLLATRGPPGH